MLIHHSDITIVIPRRGINDDNKGKKHALHRLITEAKTEYIWMQDDDIIPPFSAPPYTIAYPSHTQADLLILPLRMQTASSQPSLLERLQIAEYAAIQQLTIEAAQRGHAVMCSGANLIVKRDQWLASYLDIKPEIPSGDDMFLLESFKRQGLIVAVCDNPQYEAIVRPHTSWRAFCQQRMRWAGKAPKYTDKDILRCGAIILIANLLQIICPLIILLKFPIEYRLINKRDPSISICTALLLEILYPWYILIAILGGLFRKQW